MASKRRHFTGFHPTLTYRSVSEGPGPAQPLVPAAPAARWRAPLLAALAVALMALSAWHFRQFEDPQATDRAYLAGGLGALALLAARRYGRVEAPLEPSRVANDDPPLMVGALPAALGAAVMALLMLINSDAYASGPLARVSARVQFGLLCAGAALITWGFAGMPRLRRPTLPGWRRAVPVALILLLALALRLWDLENTIRVFVDEIHLSTGTAYFWGNTNPKLLQPIGALMPFPRLFPYWMSEAVAVFGRNFVGLRFVPAVIGTLTVGATMFLARQFFDWRTTLLGGLLVATFPPFVHFSRIALINIADPLVGALLLAFLARALHRGRRTDYALAGLCLGLTQYFYEGGKLLFPVLVVVWLAGMMAGSVRLRLRPPRLRVDWPFSLAGLVAMALTACLVVMPLAVTTFTVARPVKPRLADAALGPSFWTTVVETGDWNSYLERIDNPFLIYVRLPDEARYYGGSLPLILPPLVPLFLLGVVHALVWRPRRGAWVLPLWVALTSLGNSLLIASTIAARFIVVLPALPLLMAVGLTATLRLLLPGRRVLRFGLAAVLAATIAAGQVAYYFGPHLAEFNAQFRNVPVPDGHDALLRAAGFPPETSVTLISRRPALSGQYADQLIGYLADNIKAHVITREELNHAYMLQLSRNIDQAFFVEPDDVDSPRLIAQYFPVIGPIGTTAAIPADKAMLLYYYDAPGR